MVAKTVTKTAEDTAERKPSVQLLFSLVDKYGVSVAILVYFVVKDYLFTEKIVGLMANVNSLLQQIEPLLRR